MNTKDIMWRAEEGINSEFIARGSNLVVKATEVTKNNNVTMQAFTIRDTESKGNVCPTWYVNPETIDQTPEGYSTLCDELTQVYNSVKVNTDMELNIDRDFILSHVHPCLVNSCNKQAFKKESVTYTFWNDLLVQYRVIMDLPDGTHGSFKLSDKHLAHYDISLEELVKHARRNEAKEIRIYSMNELLKGTAFGDDDMLMFMESMPMFVVSNRDKRFGASALFNEGNVEELCEFLSDKFDGAIQTAILIPSSIHEWIVVPELPYVDTESMGLAGAIKDVNRSYLSQTEVLSDHPYKLYIEDAFIDLPLPF